MIGQSLHSELQLLDLCILGERKAGVGLEAEDKSDLKICRRTEYEMA